jgi:hypothetical protein
MGAKRHRSPARFPAVPRWVAAIAAAVVAAAVAAVIVIAAGPGSGPAVRVAPGGASPLVAILGVLRRPQSAADRHGPAALYGTKVVPGLTRLVRVQRAGARESRAGARLRVPGVGVGVGATHGEVAENPLLIELVRRGALVSGGGEWTAPFILSGQAFAYGGYAATLVGGTSIAGGPGAFGPPRAAGGGEQIDGVVPDGVARVRFLLDPGVRAEGAPIPGAVVVARVRSNVVLVTARVHCCVGFARITWIGPRGTTLKTIVPPRSPNAVANVVAIAVPARLSGAARARFEAGEAVVGETGCLACHRIGSQGNDGPGANLTRIGARLGERALGRTLSDPRAPMPSFQALPERERADLLAFLSQLR